MNRVVLLGRLTVDPEMKFTANNNVPVAKFPLAVNRPYTKQGEEKKADFFSVIAWRNRAEFASKYFRKGQQVVVEGRLENRTWDDQDGVRHYITEIIAENLYFAGSRPNNTQGQQQTANGQPSPGYYALDDEEDDLPF